VDLLIQIEEKLNKWQKILRLIDWDITIKIIETEWRKSGDIKIDLSDRKAVLLINKKRKCENLEELIIHELLHLKLFELDQMIEEQLEIIFGNDEQDPKRQFAYNQFMKVLESTVEDLTKGYLSASNSTEPLSFGRLQVQVDNELKNNKLR
jgi:hypothetical protein